MRNFFILLFLPLALVGQIKGTVTDTNNQPLAFVNIYFANSINGTTTNENGSFILECNSIGEYTIIFKYIGYETKKVSITVDKLPYQLNVALAEESLELNEISLTAKENPANRVIKKTIENRKNERQKRNNLTADYYSKGLIKIENAPEKILGVALGDYGGGLDSTRSGIIYLSETFSKISKRGNDFKEKIIASKVSGDDRGFSFNNAADVNFSLYNNTITFGNQLISPIADNAFNYYRYQLLGTFYDEQGRLINKIKVTPKRNADRVFSGELFIVEDEWTLYAVDLAVTGLQTQIPAVDSIYLRQGFNYAKSAKTWLKVLQKIDFSYDIFGFKGDGSFTSGYQNYNLNPVFDKKEFTNEVVSFAENANQKDSLYWQEKRPVPLTQLEARDYTVKDSIQIIRKSKKYLDSVDRVANKFGIDNLFFGYTYKNSFKDKSLRFSSPLNDATFNTVQGWRGTTAISYTKNNEDKGSRLNTSVSVDYGLSDQVWRPVASFSYRFNRFKRNYVSLTAGNQALQFNNSNPITPFGNTIASLFFENNFAKFYERIFVQAYYSQEL